jgi:hypothetical protein
MVPVASLHKEALTWKVDSVVDGARNLLPRSLNFFESKVGKGTRLGCVMVCV